MSETKRIHLKMMFFLIWNGVCMRSIANFQNNPLLTKITVIIKNGEIKNKED